MIQFPRSNIMSQPIFDQVMTIEKYPGKGGWSYVMIDGIEPDRKTKFGVVRVRGIDRLMEGKNLDGI